VAAVAVVGGALANKPLNGGNAWTRLSWTLGLRRLGFDVHFVEEIASSACVDARGRAASFGNSLNLDYFASITSAFGLADSATLVYERGEQVHGMPLRELEDVAAETDLLVNIGGHLTLEALKRLPRRKVYFDDDPGYTQIWHATGSGAARLDGHDVHVTVGENIGTPASTIPTGGIAWRALRPPVVLDEWPISREGEPDRFTTVGTWRNPYGVVEYEGRTYGSKVHEFRKVIELPRRVEQHFELALDIHPDERNDLELLEHFGWRLVDPRERVPDPDAFQQYVQASGAEFSVAQPLYVETNSGWFSDRTTRYLASGKPALVQETGFSRNLPVGEGLLSFRDLDEAIEGARAIAEDYERHARAARALAESYFDSDKVLGQLLAETGITP
jgi:hypothetical protein